MVDLKGAEFHSVIFVSVESGRDRAAPEYFSTI